MFNISFQHQGSRYFHVSSASPTFHEILGVKDYIFFISQVPDIYIGSEGNVTANQQQLDLLDSISSAINRHLGFAI